MKARETTKHKRFQSRLFLLLVLAISSPASLVCAQSKDGGIGVKQNHKAPILDSADKKQTVDRQRKPPADSNKPILTNGGVESGTPVKHIISTTQALVFSDPNGSLVEISIPGAQTTDLVLIGVPDATPESYVLRGSVSANDKVRVRLHTALPLPKWPTQPILCRIVVIGF